ncbi:trypsin-like serine protease [Staphylococcus haemolyticus]|uniref:trypsin-like serine protease n=1 Tax=Staphylococcus haemolyticus TaxID=1283 RepID=UPI00265BEF0F|nr:trypsin-like serine protease [Staphylococcus haemolyticus]MDO0960569.1 trypsin-like serine protease [Staphylococcus haemolyticus]
MKKFKNLKVTLILLSFLVFLTPNSVLADAYDTNNAFNKKEGSEEAFNLAQKIADDKIKIRKVDSPVTENLQAVGRFTNVKADMSGTAVAIGDYTILTNNYLVEDEVTKKGQRNYRSAAPNELKFYPMQSSKETPYSFSIKNVHMIKGVDLAVVHTNKKISDKIKPINMASEDDIKSLKYNDKISVAGYAKTKYFESRFPELTKIKYPQLFKTDGFYLNKAKTTEPQFYINAILRKGNSGSPIINSNGELIGTFVNGFNNSGASSFEYNVEEMGYGVALTDDVRQEVLENTK